MSHQTPFASVDTHKWRIKYYLRKNVFISLLSGHHNHLGGELSEQAAAAEIERNSQRYIILSDFTLRISLLYHTIYRFVILNCFDLLLSCFSINLRSTLNFQIV